MLTLDRYKHRVEVNDWKAPELGLNIGLGVWHIATVIFPPMDMVCLLLILALAELIIIFFSTMHASHNYAARLRKQFVSLKVRSPITMETVIDIAGPVGHTFHTDWTD